MAIRKFLTSVADVYGYDTQSGAIVFTGKTLLDSSMEVSLGSAPVRGGRGNQLQYIYYHTGEMKFTLTDTQWNLGMVGATVGSDTAVGDNVFIEEEVTLTGNGSGSVTHTPLVFAEGESIWGWMTDSAGTTTQLTMNSDKTFTNGTGVSGDKVCVRYYYEDAAARSLTVKANMIPSVVRLVMETQLNSADVTTNRIGMVQIIAPTVTLSGAFTISMKSDGVSNTPLTATALAYAGNSGADACAGEPYYARIVEIISSDNWYDNVIGFSIEGGDFSLATHNSTRTVTAWAIPSFGLPFRPPLTDLDFTTVADTGTVSVGLHTGLVTGLTTGNAYVVVKGASTLPDAIKAIEARCLVTNPA